MEQQVKSKERVKEHGEVFTNPREVNAMLDLVKEEASRVDSRFLEPACGNGNFLVEILRRKLVTVCEKNNADQDDFEKHTLMALASIYAIDIQNDNCEEARERMFEIVEDIYKENYPDTQDDVFLSIVGFILNDNIINGDGLTGLQVGENAGQPIVFSEWTFNGNSVTIKKFAMNDMVEHERRKEAAKKVNQGGLFAMVEVAHESEELKSLSESFFESYKMIAVENDVESKNN